MGRSKKKVGDGRIRSVEFVPSQDYISKREEEQYPHNGALLVIKYSYSHSCDANFTRHLNGL